MFSNKLGVHIPLTVRVAVSVLLPLPLMQPYFLMHFYPSAAYMAHNDSGWNRKTSKFNYIIFYNNYSSVILNDRSFLKIFVLL